MYHTGTSGILFERQAPINESGASAWADNNFSGLYTAAKNSYLAAYWVQDFEHVNQTLNVMWQLPDAETGLTLGQYTSDLNNSYPWVFTNLNYSVPAGSAFALSHYGVENYLRVYSASMHNNLQQSVYYAANYTLINTQGKAQRLLRHRLIALMSACSDGLQTLSRSTCHSLDTG